MSRPFWSSPDGAVVLHLGDCREVMAGMADRSIDHVITDPPYSEHVHANHRVAGQPTPGNDYTIKDLGFAHIGDTLRGDVARASARLVVRWVLVFSDMESAHLWRADLAGDDLDYVRTGVWQKPDATPQFSGDRPANACEAVTIAHRKGKKRWGGGGGPAFWSIGIERGPRYHTTQKPTALMRKLVELFTDPGELVLDPFAGSGTTLAACMERGRRCIGVELDEKNAEAAAKRLEQQTKQKSLFGGMGA